MPECQAKSAVYGGPVAPGERGSVNVLVHDGYTPSRHSAGFRPTTAVKNTTLRTGNEAGRGLTGTDPAPAELRRIHLGKALSAVETAYRPDWRTQPSRLDGRGRPKHFPEFEEGRGP